MREGEDRGRHTIVAARVRLGDLLLAAKEPLYEVGHCDNGSWGCGGREEARFGTLTFWWFRAKRKQAMALASP